MTYLVPIGEVLVGLSLILGALTVIGIVCGTIMNLNYLLAGTTSINPNLYIAAIILLVIGTSEYAIGLDRFIMPSLRKQYKKGELIKNGI